MRGPRRRSNNEPGQAHLLTFSCFRRKPFLRDDAHKRVFLANLARSRSSLGFEVWAYVVMPEHAHLLVWPGRGAASVAQILQSVKQPVSARLRHKVGSPPAFWQPGGGHDRDLWTDKALLAVIDYVHNNPVERGLCASPLEYPWSSAHWYEDRTGVFPVDVWTP